jgi:cell division protease FtsH
VLLGGRAAEELSFGEITTGAHNDIERATQIARHMVWEAGMSDRLGPISFTVPDGARHRPAVDAFVGRALPISEATAKIIDGEIAAFVRRAHERARELIASHRAGLERLAALLRQRETLEGDELKRALEDAVGAPVTLVSPDATRTAADAAPSAAAPGKRAAG